MPGVAQPLGRERQIALEAPHFELGVGQAALDFGATRLARMARLGPCLALPLRFGESPALRRKRGRQMLGPLAEPAQCEIEILELAPHQRHRHAEALLDHLAVALRLPALTGQAPDLGLHFTDQVVEPGKVRRGFLEPPLGALLSVAIQPDPRGLLEQRAALLRFFGEQGVDHLGFHDDCRVGPQSGAAQQILHVAQPHR